MRHTTPEEQADYEAMIARISSPLFTEADIKALEDRCNALCALVRDMLRTYRNVGMICEGCGYEMNCDGTDCQGDEYSLFLGRARELGIGVDG